MQPLPSHKQDFQRQCGTVPRNLWDAESDLKASPFLIILESVATSDAESRLSERPVRGAMHAHAAPWWFSGLLNGGGGEESLSFLAHLMKSANLLQ